MVDFSQLLSNVVPVNYPVVETEVNLAEREDQPEPGVIDRVQIKIAEGRYALLVRHHTHHHWCGYVLVDEAAWDDSDQESIRHRISPSISYVGAAGKYITWMTRTGKGRLSIPVVINGNRGEDFWIGFSVPHSQTMTHIAMMNVLYRFEKFLAENHV